MVAIVTGSGSGLERSSGSVLGGMGLLGSAAQGRSGEQLILNAANGNLMVSQRDEFLVGRGPDAAITRTYNSLGNFSDEHGEYGNNWRRSTQRTLTWGWGGLNQAGSAVRHHLGDGSEVMYHWNGAEYVATDGAGAYDKLVHIGGGWRWTDGGGQVTEIYSDFEGQARITEQSDTSGNKLTFSYSGDKLTQIATADGGWIQYHWAGNNISQIHTGFTDVATGAFRTQTRTRYGYDHLGRLNAVTVDLTPEDNVQGADAYTTTYGYHGDGRLIAWIAQTDGSRVDFGYDGAGRVTHVTQAVADGVSRTTTIGYGAGHTNITDPAGQVTTLEYNGDGSLRRVIAPPAQWGAGQQIVQFGYNGNGDLTSVTDAAGQATHYGYDGKGNVISETDRLGNVVTRTYGARNELLTETRVGSNQASGAAHHTTRYAYDSANRLRFMVSATGAVSEYWYNGLGQLFAEAQHTDRFMDVNGLAPSTPLSEGEVLGWRNSFDKGQLKIQENRYDVRGNLRERVTYGASSWYGEALTHDGYSHEFFTYDHAGQLLTRSTASVPAGQPSPIQPSNGAFLGRFGGTDGAEAVHKTYSLNPSASRATFEFDFIKLDSWDAVDRDGSHGHYNEQLTVYINGGVAFRFMPHGWGQGLDGAGGTFSIGGITGKYTVTSSGVEQNLGYSHFPDRPYHIRVELDNVGSSVRLGFGSTSDQHIDDESWGIDNVRLIQQAAVDDFENGAPAGWHLNGGTAPVFPGGNGTEMGFSKFVHGLGGTGGGEALAKTYSLNPASNRTIIDFDFLKLDSWDGEQFNLFLNGGHAFSFAPEGWHHYGPGQDSAEGTFATAGMSGTYRITSSGEDSGHRAQAYWGERVYRVHIEVDGTGPSLRLGLGTTLDEYHANENWGIDNVRVAQPDLVDDFNNGSPMGWMVHGGGAWTTGAIASTGPVLPNRESFVYDGLGRMVASTDLNGGTTSFVFRDAANQTVVTLANGFVKTSTYNRAGDLLATTESGDFVAGGSVSNRYDQLGRLRMTTDASGVNSYFVYDKLGRKVADVNQYGGMTEYRYDSNDRLVATVRYQHWIPHHLGTLANPNAVFDISEIRPAYHPTGTSATDIWTWQIYDKEGRVIEAIDGSGSAVAYEYDASDRLVRTTSFANRLEGWQIESFKHSTPATPVHPAGSAADKVARNFYDKDGLLVAALDGEGYLTHFIYDAAGQKVQEIAYANATRADLRHSHSFNDLYNNLPHHPQDRSTRYVYDGQGLLRFTINGLNQVTEYRYESGGTWTATGEVRETIRYVGAIPPLGSYTVGSVRGALAAHGLAGHGANRVDRTVYDSAGRVAYTIDAQGGVTGFSYDSMGQVIKSVRYAAVLQIGHLPSQIDMDHWAAGNGSAANRVTRNYYTDRGELRFVVDAEGFVTRNDYDASGRLQRTTRFANPVAVDDGATIYSVDRLAGGASVSTSHFYDAAGRLQRTTDGEGNHREFHYWTNGKLAWDILMHGHADESRTLYEYDAAGRMIAEHRAHGSDVHVVTRYGYDGHGNNTLVIDPNGNHTYRSYDKLGRLVSQTDANGGVTSYGYNAFGEVTRATDARNHSTYSYYDRLGRVTHVRDSEDHVTETAHNVFGEVDSVTRRYNKTWNGGNTWDVPGMHHHHLDATTRFEYDKLGRVVRTIDAEGHFEQYTLNAFGQRAEVRNKLGGVTRNAYDRRGLLVAETLPMASVHRDGWVQAHEVTNRFEYDARGNRTRMIEAAGLAEQRTTTYLYDKADRLIETRGDAVQIVDQDVYHVRGDHVPVERIRYDARGNIVETVDAMGARTLFYYDKQNRKTEQVDALGNIVSWRYDANGNLTHERRWALKTPHAVVGSHSHPSVTDQDRVTDYTYDRLNRMTSSILRGVRTGRFDGSNYQLWTGDQTTQFAYDANGNLTRTIDANGAATHNYYDRLGRRIRTVDAEGYVTGWLYDAEGNAYHERRWALKTGYADLNGWHDPSGGHENDRVTDFTYDRNGRRTSERRLVNGYGWQDGDSVISYDYNGLGQVTRKIEATAAGSHWNQHATEYSYDGAGRLTTEARAYIWHADGYWVRPVVEYGYDGLNNLTRTRQSGQLWADGPGQGERVTRYAYKAGGRLAHMWDASGAQFNYYHDIGGNLVVQTWDRQKADGSHQHEGVLYTRDVLGRVTSQALGSWYGYWVKGDVQNTAYNNFGQVSAKGINGWQEAFAYDRAGRLERSNTGDGVIRVHVYDGVGNQTLTVENEGNIHLPHVDAGGALYHASAGWAHHLGAAYVDGVNITVNVYDRRNQAVETQLRWRELGGGRIENLTMGRGYNAFGEVTVERDARGHHTHYGYNTMGRNIWIERPAVLIRHENGHQQWVRPTERFGYDRSGRLISMQDANGNWSSRALLNGTGYNGTEAIVIREHHADGGVIHNGYDVFGDLRRQTNEVGLTRHMNYDAMGRLTWEGHANGYHEAYHYDLLGQRTRHWDNYHGDQEWTDYDVQGRVTRQIAFGGDQKHTSYTWHGHLHTAGMGTYGGWEQVTTYANGRTAVEQSDMFGRDLYKRDLGGRAFGFSYDLAGRMIQRSGGEALNYTYLNTGLVGSVYTFSGEYGSQNWTRTSTSYGYDQNGNLVTEYSVNEGEESYQYYHNPYEPDWYHNSWSTVTQNGYAEYDAMNRRTHWREHGNSISPDARVWTDYDANGNVRRTYAEYRHLDQNGNPYGHVTGQELYYRYDNMNRVVTAKGQLVNGQIVRGHQGVDYGYNQAGQRVAAARTAYRTAYIHNPNYDPYYRDPYYREPYHYYDDPGYYGGEPTMAVGYEAEVREQYEYDLGGALHGVRIAESGYVDNYDGTLTVTAAPATGELKARYWQNLLGLNYRQIDYRYNGDHNGDAAYDREVLYNAKDQVYGENVYSRQGADWITNIIRHDFAANGEYALGAITYTHSHNYKNNNDGALANTETRTWYAWYDGAVQSRIEFRPDTGSGTRFNTYFSYDGSGHLLSAQINDGRPRTVSYRNDLTGQTLRRDESDRNYSSGDPHEVWYRFGGRQMGYVGNNGTLDTDYKSSIDNRMRTGSSTTGAFRFGASYGSSYADFDLSVDPFTSYEQGGAGGSHTVRAGESLQSIAQNLWGDSNLWYRLAEANGMAGALSEGQRLTIPAGVMKNTHNAGTLKPYDPSEIIGDVNPTTPQPQKAGKKGNKCGVLGAILLVAVAVAVTIATQGATTGFFTSLFAGSAAAGSAAAAAAATAGAIVGGAAAGVAGSIASQAFGLATGIQDKFSWKGVALAGISGGVGGGLGSVFPGAGAVSGALRAAAGSLVSQGIGIATGLQKKFDWAGVAAAGVIGGVVGAAGLKSLDTDNSIGNHLRHAGVGAASAIAGAATRSAISGTDFGDNILAVLPDVIGTTIGNAIGYGVSRPRPRLTVDPSVFAGDDSLTGGSGTALAAPGVSNASAAGPVPGAGGGQVGDLPPEVAQAVANIRAVGLSGSAGSISDASRPYFTNFLTGERLYYGTTNEALWLISGLGNPDFVGEFDGFVNENGVTDFVQRLERATLSPNAPYQGQADNVAVMLRYWSSQGSHFAGAVHDGFYPQTPAALAQSINTVLGMGSGTDQSYSALSTDFFLTSRSFTAGQPSNSTSGLTVGSVLNTSAEILIPGYYASQRGNEAFRNGNYLTGALWYLGATGEIGLTVATLGTSAALSAGARGAVRGGIVVSERLAVSGGHRLLAEGLEFETRAAAAAGTEAFAGPSGRRVSVRAFDDAGNLLPGRTVLDQLGTRLDTGTLGALEFKLSPNAPYTARQLEHFPNLARNGGVVVGRNGERIGLPAGTRLPAFSPSRVNGPSVPEPNGWWTR